MDFLVGLGRGLIQSVLPLYRDTNFAYAVASVMAALALLLAAIALLRHIATVSALVRRRMQITSFIAFNSTDRAADADPQEEQFANRFREIDAAMSKPGLLMSNLAQAWRRYRKTFNFENAPPIRSTQRPNTFFYGAAPPPTWLGFSANLFIGFGLLATFLGLVAALTFASEGMRSVDTGAMQQALRDLLGAAASKFVTSIAGVGLSILLSLVERLLTADLRRHLDNLSSALELGIRVDTEAHSAAVADRIARLVETIERSVSGVPAPGSERAYE